MSDEPNSPLGLTVDEELAEAGANDPELAAALDELEPYEKLKRSLILEATFEGREAPSEEELDQMEQRIREGRPSGDPIAESDSEGSFDTDVVLHAGWQYHFQEIHIAGGCATASGRGRDE